MDIQVNGCVYTFTVLNLGPGNSSDLCVAGDPFGAGVIVPLASATWTVDFSGQCTGWGYCFTVFCCDDDPANGVTLCVDGYADCCCNADFVLTQDVNCCVTVEALNPGLCLDATGVATADVNGDGVIDGADTQLLLANGCCQFDMGDGTIYNGPGPFTHCYAQNGVYNVCYTTCCLLPDGTLVTDTQCQLVDINCCNVPLFDFSWSAFNDPLCPTGCAIAFDCPVLGPEFCVTWDFGDGTVTSGLANCPIHCYQGCGTYTVCLTVYCCNDPSQSLTICHEVTPDCCTLPFDWFETVVDCEACFSPIFEGPCPTDCLFWDFGDGTLGTGLNPCHDYGQSGTYTVCLTACCCDNIDAAGNVIDPSLCTTICKDITVNCCTVPDFDFSWGYSTNPLCPDGCSIGFNCPVLGPDLCVHWDFGDGTTYDTPNACPIHCYELCGVYEVCLTVYCCNDPSQAITVCHQVVADCCCDVDPEFTVTPLGDCCFEFNDPTPSLNSPQLNNCGVFEIFDLTGNLIASGLGDSWIYCFTTSGSYIVCHTDCCINPDGTLTQETFCIDLLVDCPCPQPTDLEITAVSGDNCEWGFCVLGGFDISKHCATWDFGDGTVQNFPLDICPIHQYLCDGIYDVCVTVYCCDDPSISTTVCTTILVDCPCSLPQVDFVVDIDECSVNTDVIILLDTPCPNDYCFSWDFGDGSPAVSGPSASHTYNADGVYVICLTVYCCDDPSISYIICQTVEVDCPCELPVDLDILAVTTDDCQWAFCVEGGINVNEHCVTWDYGDGIVENHPIDFCPLHQYLCDGVYTVCATVYCCNDPSISVTVCTTIVVDCPCTLPDVTLVYNTYDDCSITANALIDSPCPDNYCFTWDFGDGSILVNGPATVSHTYGASGWYTLCVTVFCCDEPLLPGITTCVDIYIDCGCTLPSFVDFSLDVIGCTVDVSAFYTDDYSGNICFEWNWGDGTTSTGDTGSHTYSQSGAYLICLNVFCCDNPNEVITICHEVCVVCPCDIINPDFEVTIDGCTACFNPTISGLPAGSDICYDFHFDMANDPFIGTGDMNPCYTYDASGTYTVCMHIWCCNDLSTIIEVCKEITVVCDCTLPQVDIAYTFDGCTGVFQVVGSDVNSACYSWDFGDGTTGSGISPSHTYGASGTYTVCLTVYCCDDTTIAYTICLIVTVDCPACDLPSGAGFDCVINNCTLAVGAFYTDDYDGQLCFLYEWGDGTPPAFGEIAAHTYFASGTYTVCLTIFCCNDPLVNMVVCKEVTVECNGNCPEPCELDPRFVWNTDPFTYAQGCCVHFTDVSVAGTYTNITGWSWDFGDGTTSNQQNPTHCYTNDNAVHTVCLTITGTSPEGTCTETFCWDVHCGCSDTCPTDVNHDGVTNTQDLLILLASWTQLCP